MSKKAGLPIKEIKTFMDWCMEGDNTIDKRLALMQEQRDIVKKQIAQMQDTLAILDYKCWYYETAREAGTCKIHDSLPDEAVPSEFAAAKEKTQTL